MNHKYLYFKTHLFSVSYVSVYFFYIFQYLINNIVYNTHLPKKKKNNF